MCDRAEETEVARGAGGAEPATEAATAAGGGGARWWCETMDALGSVGRRVNAAAIGPCFPRLCVYSGRAVGGGVILVEMGVEESRRRDSRDEALAHRHRHRHPTSQDGAARPAKLGRFSTTKTG